MTTQITQIAYFLFPLLFILGGYYYRSFQNLKSSESRKTALLLAEISSEKEVAYQLKSVSKETQKLNNATQEKLLKIKVGVFNIDFSLGEILQK